MLTDFVACVQQIFIEWRYFHRWLVQYFRPSLWTVAPMDEGTIKTPSPKCHLYWCLIEFIDSSCVILPLYLLSGYDKPSVLNSKCDVFKFALLPRGNLQALQLSLHFVMCSKIYQRAKTDCFVQFWLIKPPAPVLFCHCSSQKRKTKLF
jgi:hypothetical protein